MPPAACVDALNANTGAALSADERAALGRELTAAGYTAAARAATLLAAVEGQDFLRAQNNRAFVYMQYVGYLRRSPDTVGFDGQADPNYTGFNFWLAKLVAFNGDFIRAEMVKAFLNSIEYGMRFGR